MKRIILLCVIFLFCLKTNAQSGELDLSFGVKGIVKTDFGFIYDYDYNTTGRQILLQPDGSMYILIEAGTPSNHQSYIGKRLSDGSLDVSYGNNGYSNPVYIADAVAAQQADGKIVVSGVQGGSYTIARINTDGSLDNLFDGDGLQTVEFPPTAVAVQSDGKIIVAGFIANENDNDFALARYNNNGSLDNTFDGDGKQTTDFGGDDKAVSITLQTDNKIIVAGQTFQPGADFAIARYNNDGSPDNDFSDDGKQITDLNSSEDIAESVITQSDGKIIIGGYALIGGSNQFAVVRYNIDGTPDNTFDGDGKQITDFATECLATSVSIQDEKILLAGYAFTDGNADFALARFNTDGSLDNSFGNNGKQITDFAGNDHANSVAVKSDGKILVSGGDDDGAHFALARYTPNGILDNTFDGDGKLTDRLHLNQGSTYYTSTAVQNDGKILAAGYTWNGNNYDFAIARYNTNGNLDNSFSGDGKQTTDFNAGDDYAYSLAIQTDGKIVVAGVADSNFALARYNADGTPDNSFSGDGKQITDFGFDDNASSVIIQADKKIVVAGWSVNGIDFDTQEPIADFALARYNANGTSDSSFSDDGKTTTNFGFDEKAKSVAMQSDNKILVAGTQQSHALGELSSQFALARYNINGSLDNSFSGDGKQLTIINENQNASANSIAVQSDGKIVAGGNTGFGSEASTDFALARYNTNGNLDNTFGEAATGIQTTYFGDVYKFSNPIAIQGDGKIILAGGANGNFTLARYNSDGTSDNTFSDNGIEITPASVGDDRIEGIVISNDQIYAAGYGEYPGSLGVVARYLLAAGGPTPVRFVDLTAALKNKTAVLQWQTATEQNLSHFIIERSADAHNFSTIGTVKASGNSTSVKTYSITDQQPLQGINFYRLKMVDADGKFMYSKTVAVKIDDNNITLLVFPNPAKDILLVQASGIRENATIQIINAAGRKLKESKIRSNGNTSLSFDISSLPPGLYNLIFNKKGKAWVRKFIKE